MNINKLRDQYSDYYSGSLEPAMKEVFERQLSSDSNLREDYEQFVQAVSLLDSFDKDEIEVPHDLHETISARLDKYHYDVKQSQKVSFWSQWKLALAGGVAVFAIVASILTLQPQKSTINNAGISVSRPSLEFVYEDNKVELHVFSRGSEEIEVRNLTSGDLIKEIALAAGETLESPIDNKTESPVVIQASVGQERLTIMMPGISDKAELSSNGSVMDCAKALAAHYRTPIIMRSGDFERQVEWDFNGIKDASELPAYLDTIGITASIRKDGFLILTSR